MGKILALIIIVMLTPQTNLLAQDDNGALAIMLPGGGTYSRPIITDSEQAQAFFDQGLRLAWGFYFPESIASYQEAARLDPDSPMPHFGLAHAAGPNPNSRSSDLPDDPHGAGFEAIRKALALANNGSQRERDMINALFVLYNKDGIPDSGERDLAFLDAMRNLHAKYPDDADIATIFAESYMNTTPWIYWEADGSPKPGTMEAKAALESAINSEHDHPGANHLYIHLMEASSQPELAMASAQKLENTLPISGHMVHMPGHIYLRVGEYEKAVDINERSQMLDLQLAEIWGDTNFPNIGTYPLSHKAHAPHALDFVRYANMMQGNYAEASAAAERGVASLAPETVNRAQKRVVHSWALDKIFGKYDKLLSSQQSHSGTPYLDGMWSYMQGSAHVAKENLGQAEVELANIRTQIKAENVDSNDASPSTQSHILNLASHALRGEIEEAKGNLDAAIAHYNMAVNLQDTLSYTEPPHWTQSMRLYLGAVLIDAGRAEEAEQIYLEDLQWNQRNGWATFGFYQALDAQGKTQEAIIIKRQFESLFRNADVEITRSRL